MNPCTYRLLRRSDRAMPLACSPLWGEEGVTRMASSSETRGLMCVPLQPAWRGPRIGTRSHPGRHPSAGQRPIYRRAEVSSPRPCMSHRRLSDGRCLFSSRSMAGMPLLYIGTGCITAAFRSRSMWYHGRRRLKTPQLDELLRAWDVASTRTLQYLSCWPCCTSLSCV